MAKKKGKGKKSKKKVPEIDPNALSEVDKTFYELTITDLNRKLARLRSLTAELEEKNEGLQRDLKQLDEDRNDVIIFLKRSLEEQASQINELQDRITALQETRQDETLKYEETITEMKNEYKQMHEQLTSDNKLLEGKLNSLEEFRSQRDELMKKFEKQENDLEEQEKRHKEELYQIEKKFIISKDKMKKDMEERLLQLSTDFQNATELQIAATTKQVIRENITINNKMEGMIEMQKGLWKKNDVMQSKLRTYKQECELHEEEKKVALRKVNVQKSIIKDLTSKYEFLKSTFERCTRNDKELEVKRDQLQETEKTISGLEIKVRILEQNLHASRSERTTIQTQNLYYKDENERLFNLLMEATVSIKEVLQLKPVKTVAKRENLLNTLFALLSTAATHTPRLPSLDSVDSIEATYKRGDLGFVPKPVELRSKIPFKCNVEMQTGSSIWNLSDMSIEKALRKSTQLQSEISLQKRTETEVRMVLQEDSIVFFDEEEMGYEFGEEESRISMEMRLSERKSSTIQSHDMTDDPGKQELESRTDTERTSRRSETLEAVEISEERKTAEEVPKEQGEDTETALKPE